MNIIDMHAHIYPDAIAKRAAQSIGTFYDIPMCMDGTLDQLLLHGKIAGFTKYLVHSVAVTETRVHSVNDFLMKTASEHPDLFVGFGSMHPLFDDIPAELERMRQGGLKGVKLHPDTQNFHLDDERAIEMFEHIAKAKMPALIHTGDHRYPYSQPERMARVLDAVPDLIVICAHLGGWSVWSDAWKVLAKYENVYVDTSSSLYALEPSQAVDIIRQYPKDHVFFGTDYPMWDPESEMARFDALPLTNEEREAILHQNAEAFLNRYCQ